MRDRLLTLARQQGWVWSYQQAMQAGYTRSEVRARVLGGRWSRVFRGVYAPPCMASDLAVRTKAAMLISQPGLVAGGTTAAALLGFGVIDDGCVHLVGPRGTDAAAHDGLHVHQAALSDRDVIVLTNGIRAQGWQPLYFTDVHVYRRPEVMVSAIRRELARRGH